MKQIEKPGANEYDPDVIKYISLVPDDWLVLEHLQKNFEITRDTLLFLPEDKLIYSYAERKWTIKEIVQHITDSERVYSYRALRFARNDATELPGFDQDEFAAFSNANQRSIKDLLDELASVRQATISLYQGLSNESLLRKGIANQKVMSVRAIIYDIAGHELWHMNIIRRLYL
jgi:uncharacterized damage-inducible protein DinB